MYTRDGNCRHRALVRAVHVVKSIGGAQREGGAAHRCCYPQLKEISPRRVVIAVVTATTVVLAVSAGEKVVVAVNFTRVVGVAVLIVR